MIAQMSNFFNYSIHRYGVEDMESLDKLGVRIQTADKLFELLKEWRLQYAPCMFVVFTVTYLFYYVIFLMTN